MNLAFEVTPCILTFVVRYTFRYNAQRFEYFIRGHPVCYIGIQFISTNGLDNILVN